MLEAEPIADAAATNGGTTKYIMALLEKKLAALRMGGTLDSTTITSQLMIAAPVVAFAQSTNKTKVGAAPNIGAGIPLSLAAILSKAGSQKLGSK